LIVNLSHKEIESPYVLIVGKIFFMITDDVRLPEPASSFLYTIDKPETLQDHGKELKTHGDKSTEQIRA